MCSKRSYQCSVFRFALSYFKCLTFIRADYLFEHLVLSSCHYSQCSINSHSTFTTYLTAKFSYPYVQSLLSDSLLILETASRINQNLCLFDTALSSLESSQHFSQLCYSFTLLRAGEGGSISSFSISPQSHLLVSKSSQHRVPAVAQQTDIIEDAGSIPGLTQWVRDLALLWLWCRLAATAIRPLAWEPPCAVGMT